MGKQSDDENGQLHYKRTLNIALAMTDSISRMLKSLPNILAITGGVSARQKEGKEKAEVVNMTKQWRYFP